LVEVECYMRDPPIYIESIGIPKSKVVASWTQRFPANLTEILGLKIIIWEMINKIPYFDFYKYKIKLCGGPKSKKNLTSTVVVWMK
jgi:hypothetical protein